MSKFFFKGRVDPRDKLHSVGFKTKRSVRPGTEENPLELVVTSEARKAEVEAIVQQNTLFASISVDEEGSEQLEALDAVLNTPSTVVLEKTPKRNDPCSCGSGKKYKKCCG